MTRLSLKSLLIIIVVLLIGIVGLWQIQRKAQPVKADWFNESWMYRKSIGISNASGTNQSNFRVNLSIGTSSLIAAGKMKSDCTDVRLTDIQGKLLPHWVQTGTCNTDATVIWTKIPFLSTSANLIYFYYGNPSADDITDSSVLPDSCSTVNAYLGSGLHYVDPDGKTGQNPFQAYCDMTTDGGGWSLVASWGTAPEWTKTSTSTAAVVGGTTPVNTVSANFGNVVINDFRILASDTATTVASNAYADWYYHYDTATTWKEVWAPTPNKGGDLVHTYRSTTPRQALKPFNYAYNLRFSYQVTQTYNNLSDWGISDQYAGCLPDYWAALTSPGNPFGVYSLSYYSGANGANCSGSVGDGSLGICPSNQSGCITGQDMSTNNAKIGYDDGNACAGFASVGTTNVGELPGVQANTKLWWFIRRTAPASVAYSVASAGSEEASPAPIAYWKFDEGVGTTVYDSSSNQNNGVFGAGSSAPTWQSEDMCITGKCLLFDGSKTYLGIGMTNNINQIFTSFTVSAWIKFSSNPATQRGIVSKGSASGNNRFDLNIETNGKIRFWFSSSGNTAFSKSALSINTWHHIVGIWNGTQSIVYVDGIAGTAINNSPSVTISSDPIYIGSWNRESPWFFNGYIDEVKIYAYARTPAQIKQDYQAGRAKVASNKGGSTVGGSSKSLSDGLVGYWKMDEGVGTSTADYSGNNNTGMNNNSNWVTGKYGIGISLSGSNSRINIGSSSSLNTGDYFTISGWYKFSSINAGDNYFYNRNSQQTTNGFHIIYISGASSSIGYQYTNGSNIVTKSSSTLSWNTGQWYHIAIVHDNINKKIYFYRDGTNVGTAAYTDNALNVTNGTGYFGGYQGDNRFNGVIDEIRIYNRALSPEEVRALYAFNPNPVAYWNFEEGVGTTSYDKSGNNYNIGLINGASWTQGKYGKGIKLVQANSQYLDAGNILSPGANDFSISMWFNSSGCTSGDCILLNKENLYEMKAVSGSSVLFAWQPYWSWVGSGFTFNNNQWNYLTVVYDHVNQYLYKNGVLVYSRAQTGNMGSNTARLLIGARGDTNPYYFFNGLIDEVKIYNYAISPKQIIADMNAGHPAVGSPVGSAIGYWKFDEGYGTIVNNSGNGGIGLSGIFGSGNSAPTWTNNGKFGKALSFDGNDYIDAGTNPALNITGNISATAWVKWTGTIGSGGYAIAAKGNDGIYFQIRKDGGSGSKIAVWYSAPVSAWRESNTNVTSDIWHHIAFTYDGSYTRFYLDGKTDGSIATTGTMGGGSGKFLIGNVLNTGRYFNGLIDEVKIYNYALTEDEVKLDYNHGASSNIGVLSKNTGNTAPNTAQSQAYCIPGDTSYCAAPIAEWNMEEKVGSVVYDTSGNGFTGAITGATWTQGKVGQALKFSGSSQYIDFNPDILDAGCSGTISLWIKRGPWNESYNTILMKSNGGSWVNNHVQISRDSTTDNIIFEIADNSNSTSNQVTTGTINENTWYHLTMSWNGTTLIGYVNGQEVDRYSTSICPASDSTRFSLGRGAVGTNRYFNGIIDQVKIYNYARTPAQVAWDYNRGAPIGWWKFDECQGNIAHDASGVGNTGTIVIGAGGSQVQLGTCGAGDTSAWSNGKTGKLNSAMSFDGTDDYVGLGSQVGTSTTFTASTWFKRNGASNYHGIMHGITGDGSYTRILVNSSGSVITLQQRDIGGTVVNAQWSSQPFGDNNWHHITYSFDGSNIKLYTDGKLQGSPTACNGVKTGSSALEIGRGQSNDYYTSGLIDDVRIYNYALTGEQIKQIYNDGAVKFN